MKISAAALIGALLGYGVFPSPKGVQFSHNGEDLASFAKQSEVAVVAHDGEDAPPVQEEQSHYSDLGKSDPVAGIAGALKLISSRRGDALAAVFSAWLSTDPSAAWRWLASTPVKPEVLAETLGAFGRAAASLDCDVVLHNTSQLRPQDQPHLLRAYLMATESSNVLSFRDNFLKLNAFVQGQTIASLMSRWGAMNPQDASDWVARNGLDPGLKQSAYDGIAAGIAATNPAAAVEWALKLPRDISNSALRNPMNVWLNQKGSEDFVSSFRDLAPDMRAQLGEHAFQALLHVDPARALELTDFVGPVENMTAQRLKGLAYLSAFNPEDAAQWVSEQASRPDYPNLINIAAINSVEHAGVGAFSYLRFARNQQERQVLITSLALNLSNRPGSAVTLEQVRALGLLAEDELSKVERLFANRRKTN